MRLHCRWMIRRDLPEVLEADSYYNARNPWLEEDFLHFLRKRNCIGMVVEQGERVVGFMVYELHKDHLELVRIAVHPTMNDGEAKVAVAAMLDRLAAKLSAHRRNRISLTVDERDTHIHHALKANGFEAVRVERGWWTDEDDSLHDGYRFVWRLLDPQPVVQQAEAVAV